MAFSRTSPHLASRVAKLHMEAASSDSKNIEWGLKIIQKAVQELEDVADAWSARGSKQGEGFESLADSYGDVQRFVSFMKGREGAELLRLIKHLDLTKSNVRAIERMNKRASDNPLDGLPKRRAANQVNGILQNLKLGGFFKDSYWKPVNSIWQAFKRQGIPFGITKSTYEYDRSMSNMPVRKVWEFEIPFVNSNNRPDTLYGRVVAAGAGSEEDPLTIYDVTAYVN